jgi:PAS domain S-box-containing protein
MDKGGRGAILLDCQGKERMADQSAKRVLGYRDADEIAAIYDSAPIGLAVVDTEGRYVRVNRKLAEINGVPVEQHIGRTMAEIVPHVVTRTMPFEERLQLGTPHYGIEVKAETRARPGVLRTFRQSWTPLRNESGEIVGLSIAVEEIAPERDAARDLLITAEAARTAEQEARRLAALLGAIGDTSPDLIYAKDRQGRLLYANPATAQVIGRPLGEILGKAEAEWGNDPDEARAIAAIDARIMREGRQEIAEEIYTSPDGTRRIFRSAKSPVRDASGEVVGLAGVSTDITAIRESEQAVRQSEERLRFSLEAGRMVAWDFDLTTGRARRSANAKALFGLEPEGSDDFYRIVHPDDLDRLKAAQAKAVAGEPYDLEFRWLSPGGEAMWAAIQGKLRRDPDGNPVAISGVLMDITARKWAEIAAAKAGAEFQTMAENVSQLVWTANPDGRVIWYNRRWYDYTGVDPGMPEDHAADLVHPNDVERVRARWAERFGAGISWEDTFRLRGRDGQYRWFLSRAEPIRNRKGAIVRWFGTNTDVTDQIETAEALARSEALFRTTAEALPGLLFVGTPEGRNTYVNPAYQAFTGLPEQALLDLGYLAIVHPDDLDASNAAWQAALRDGTHYETEFRLRRHDGEWRWQLVRALPVRGADGTIDRWVGTCTDIHERRTAEEELQLRVEEVIAERETAMLQLHEAQKIETVGQLTGGVAHDFNNLLTPIVGSLDLLRRRLEDERSVRLIDGALASAERARTLIQRLLAFARRQTLQPRAVDPKAVVDGMRELIERSLGPRVEFRAVVAPDLPPALIDPNQLELALLNLSLNARDAMPDGGRIGWSVSEETIAEGRRELTAGRYIRIEVADTGVGMDADTLARAVEPFFSTKPAGKGTGLGLSMVHGWASQSGGAFRLESVPGQGTTATLWIPVATEGQVPAPVRDPDARSAARRALVLLVDDEEQVRFTTSESLIELGYDVVSLGSGQEALDEVAGGLRPDLLVTDHLMPGMTGAQLAMELRRKLPGLPILMITGYAQLRPEEAGDFDVLVKPYRHAELALRIAELLSEEPVLQRALS